MTVGSHTHSHALLDRLPDADLADELDRSIDLIGERVGVAAVHFAYPKAVMGSPAADRAVRARFASAALAGGRANRPGRTDPHRLARTPVQVSDGERWFRRKAGGGLALEETIRGRREPPPLLGRHHLTPHPFWDSAALRARAPKVRGTG